MSISPKNYVAGHRGMVGPAIVLQLLVQGQSQAGLDTKDYIRGTRG